MYNARESQLVSVTLSLNAWSHILSSLRVAMDVMGSHPIPDGHPAKEAAERFGDPAVVVPGIHDDISGQLQVTIGETGFFGDRL